MEELIEIDPEVMLGKPVIKGTRITVELVLEKLAAGQTIEAILASYPHLNRKQILACLDYAHRSLSSEIFLPATPQAA